MALQTHRPVGVGPAGWRVVEACQGRQQVKDLLLLLLMLPVLPLMSLLLLPVLELVLLLLRRGQAVQHSSVAMVLLTRRQSTMATLPNRSKSPTWQTLLLLLLVLLTKQAVQHCPLSMNPILTKQVHCRNQKA